jgi:hypothetical protein
MVIVIFMVMAMVMVMVMAIVMVMVMVMVKVMVMVTVILEIVHDPHDGKNSRVLLSKILPGPKMFDVCPIWSKPSLQSWSWSLVLVMVNGPGHGE